MIPEPIVEVGCPSPEFHLAAEHTDECPWFDGVRSLGEPPAGCPVSEAVRMTCAIAVKGSGFGVMNSDGVWESGEHAVDRVLAVLVREGVLRSGFQVITGFCAPWEPATRRPGLSEELWPAGGWPWEGER